MLSKKNIQYIINQNNLSKVKDLFNNNDHNESHYKCALKQASINGYTNIVDFLLQDSKIYKDIIINFYLILAAEHGHLELFKFLLNYNNGKINKKRSINYPLVASSKNGHIDIVSFLLTNTQIEIEKSKYTAALTEAVKEGHFKIVEILLKDPRVDPSDDEQIAFEYAIEKKQIDIIKIIIKDKRIDVTYPYNYAIALSFKNKTTEITRLLWEDTRVKDTLRNDHEKIYIALKKNDLEKKVKGF
jgi:ankyrin repeat protein